MENTNSLNQHISYKDCVVLNAEGVSEVNAVLGMGGSLRSNKDDPELIIIVKFLSNVNISGIKLESSNNEDFNPQTMQLFVNNNAFSFSDVGTVKATEAYNMSNNFGKTLPLKVAKFRNVSTLAVISVNIAFLFK
jgi:hypothetical protein